MPKKAIVREVKRVEEEITQETKGVILRVVAAIVIFFVLIFGGGLIYHHLEYYPGTIQHWSYLDGIYFAAVTVTTLGYGDFVPATQAGKIFTVFYAFFGVAIVFYVFFVVGRYLMHYNNILLRRGGRRFLAKRSARKKLSK